MQHVVKQPLETFPTPAYEQEDSMMNGYTDSSEPNFSLNRLGVGDIYTL